MILNITHDKVPETDDDVEAYLSRLCPGPAGTCLIGIYRCRRGLGECVLKAYEYTLLANIGATERGQEIIDRIRGMAR